MVSLFSVANEGSSEPDIEVGVEQVYVLNGMNKCLIDRLPWIGDGQFHLQGGQVAMCSHGIQDKRLTNPTACPR